MPLIYIPASKLVRPRWGRRFARNANESQFPGLWLGKQEHFVPALGPTGLTTLKDISNLRHDIALVSFVASDFVVSEMGHALQFDGTATRGSTTSMDRIVARGSISVWVKRLDNVTGDQVFKGDESPNRLYLQTRAVSGISTRLGTSATENVENVWFQDVSTHIVLGWDDTLGAQVHRAWVDGVLVTDTTYLGTPRINSFQIGNNPGGFYNGLLSELIVYNRLLTTPEVRILHDYPYAPLMPRLCVYGKGPAPTPPIEPSLLPEYGQVRTAIGDPPIFGATIVRS